MLFFEIHYRLLNDECVKTHSFIHIGDEEKQTSNHMKQHPLKLNTIRVYTPSHVIYMVM
jgi:hypothetical protein